MPRSKPTRDDWELFRPLIQRMYMDEKKELKEIVVHMNSQYGHKATYMRKNSHLHHYLANKR